MWTKSALVGATSLLGVGIAQADSLTTGIVNADGSKQTNGPYTVSHPSAGRYIITLTNYTGAAICIFNAVGTLTNVHHAVFSTKTCDVTFANKKNVATSTLFSFFAAPPS